MHRHGGADRPRIRLALTLAIASVFFAAAAHSQEPTFGIGDDASVVAPGTLRVGFRADFLFADAVRLSTGDRAPLASRVGFRPNDNVSFAAAVSVTRLPIVLEYGMLPRVSLSVTAPVVRRRVESAADTGVRRDTTTRPTMRLTDTSALGSLTHTNVADIEFGARVGVLDNFASRAPLRVRLSVEGVFRLAAGPSRNAGTFLDPGAGDGQNDVELRVLGDVAVGPRLWISARVAQNWQRPDRQLVVYKTDVFPSDSVAHGVPRDLGDVLMIDVTPRFRFTRFLSLAATISQRHKTADVYQGGAPAPGWGLVAEPTGEYWATRAGFGIVFSTAPSGGAIGPWPLELAFQHAVTVHSAGEPVPDYRVDQLAGRLFIKLF